MNKKQEVVTVSAEFLKEYIGTEVQVTMDGDLGYYKGILVSVEDNWMKLDTKKRVELLNGDMVKQVSIRKEK